MTLHDTFPCKIINRINRFIVKVNINGKLEEAYNTNTGRLNDLLKKGNLGVCTKKDNGKLKLALRGVFVKDSVAIIDTMLQMKAFEAAVKKRAIRWLRNCAIKKRNPKIEDSVFDYLLICDKKEIYLEIKSAVLKHKGGLAGYPDCPSIRGRRHIETLKNLSLKGVNAMIIFIAALPVVRGFSPYDKGDPEIRVLLKDAAKAGVIIKALNMFGVYEKNFLKIFLGNDDLPVLL